MKLVKTDAIIHMKSDKQEEYPLIFTEAAISNKLQYSASLFINDNDLNAEVSWHHTN
jgi:hypothetical protein